MQKIRVLGFGLISFFPTSLSSGVWNLATAPSARAEPLKILALVAFDLRVVGVYEILKFGTSSSTLSFPHPKLFPPLGSRGLLGKNQSTWVS